MTDATYLTGQFLLALPGMADPRFERSVIAMCGHDAEGAIGINIGAVVAGIGLHEVLGQLDLEPGVAPDAPVHFGGPVETRRGFVLHSRDWEGQDTVDVAGRWRMTGTLDVLRAISEGKGPAEWLVALGYAGWGAGQLEGEMTRHGWLTVPGDEGLIYDVPPEERWKTALVGAGIDPRLLAGQTGTA